jgi:hypothetical protein
VNNQWTFSRLGGGRNITNFCVDYELILILTYLT